MNMLRNEIPIKCCNVNAFICKIENGISKYLIIRRASKSFNGSWQMVSGGIEKGEKGWETAIREIKEETGLTPKKFYSSNIVETVYLADKNCISMVPVFLAFVDLDCEVVLNVYEHDEYKWVTVDEAEEYLVFFNQLESMRKIEEYFIKREPNEFLEISFTSNEVEKRTS